MYPRIYNELLITLSFKSFFYSAIRPVTWFASAYLGIGTYLNDTQI